MHSSELGHGKIINKLQTIINPKDIRFSRTEKLLTNLQCLHHSALDSTLSKQQNYFPGMVWGENISQFLLPEEDWIGESGWNIDHDSTDSKIFDTIAKNVAFHSVLLYWPLVIKFLKAQIGTERLLSSKISVVEVRNMILDYCIPDENSLRTRLN